MSEPLFFISYTLIKVHAEPSGGASGQASDIAIHAKEILRIREVLTGIYQKHCGKEGESSAAGLRRFGMYPRMPLVRCLFAMCILQERLLNEIIL